MEWFTEPVWLGNYIIARWAALLFVGGSLILSVIVAALTVFSIWAVIRCTARFVWKQIRF